MILCLSSAIVCGGLLDFLENPRGSNRYGSSGERAGHSLSWYKAITVLWAYGVVVSMFDFHRSDWGSNPNRGGKISLCLRLHFERHPWQLYENLKPCVHPSHVREIG